MSLKQILTACAAVATASVLASTAQAAIITGLYNTGVDNAGVALAGGNGVVDPHYVIASSTSPGFAGASPVTYYNGAYVADDADSRWISLTSNGTPVNNTTVYRLTFDLSGLDATTAQIAGRWGTDNGGSILLNGVATGFTSATFTSLASFNITSGFVSGINTLDFSVNDFGVVTAFRVDDLRGTADVLAGGIPEPSTWTMMILGFGAGGAMLRRRVRTAAA